MSPVQKIRLNQELVYPGAGALPASPDLMVRCTTGIGGVGAGAGYNNLMPIPTLSVPPVLYLTPSGSSNAAPGSWTIPTITTPSRESTLEDIQQIPWNGNKAHGNYESGKHIVKEFYQVTLMVQLELNSASKLMALQLLLFASTSYSCWIPVLYCIYYIIQTLRAK